MSIVVIDSITKVKEPYEGEYNGRPYTSYEWLVAGNVDGEKKDKITIKTTKQDISERVVAGSAFECEFKDNKGFKSYKIIAEVDPALVGAGKKEAAPSGGRSFSGSTNRSIERQVALKCAVEFLRENPEASYEGVIQAADAFDAWLKGG